MPQLPSGSGESEFQPEMAGIFIFGFDFKLEYL